MSSESCECDWFRGQSGGCFREVYHFHREKKSAIMKIIFFVDFRNRITVCIVLYSDLTFKRQPGRTKNFCQPTLNGQGNGQNNIKIFPKIFVQKCNPSSSSLIAYCQHPLSERSSQGKGRIWPNSVYVRDHPSSV